MGNCYKDTYTKEYYKRYSVGDKYVDYQKSDDLKKFFDAVAERIIEMENPRSVLDIGCAMGFLVASLRDRGVQAYGIDVSKYAISCVREDIKQYCKVCSSIEKLPKTFPEKFDLVFNIEMIEHLYEDDGLKTIENMCNYADKIVFSSTDSDIEEPTHYNVQPIEYWSKNFAKNRFYHKLDKDVSFISKCAVMYEKEDVKPYKLVEDYERTLRITKIDNLAKASENSDLKEKVSKQEKEIKLLNEKHESLVFSNEDKQNEIEYLEEKIYQQNKLIVSLENEVDKLSKMYQNISGSRFWKMTLPLRKLMDKSKRVFKNNKFTKLFYKGLASMKNDGFKATLGRVKYWFFRDNNGKKYIRNNIPTKQRIKFEESKEFKNPVKISILVPLYNTPAPFLKEMIESVLDQTYKNWELCLADGSDNEHSYVEKMVKEYLNKDKRIKYKKLEKNLGISGNTNECIKLSSGDYIALFDHDDLLHQSALFDVVTVINEKNADFIYTDECSFNETIKNPESIHFKPDFSPDTLRSYNYICHFSVFSRELLNQVGEFSSEHDGSQDYDMILRLTEKANKIVHIPRILYYWRIHSGSVASDISVKMYCLDAAKRAIKDHLDRVGLDGEVEDSTVVTTYKVNYKIKGEPLISILIPNKDHVDDLKKCINSIILKSTYKNYEIIIIENNSEDDKTFTYYKSLKGEDRIKVVYYEGGFNYSAINNFGFKYSNGDYILLLNNDVEVINHNWLEEMLMFAQREDVGAVGAKLLFPDDTIQHGGVIVGINGVAGHAHKGWPKDSPGYAARLSIAQNMSAVTAACVMIPRNVYVEVDGLDESFAVAFNDIDLCLRIRECGYLIVYTPYAQLYHYESKSRGYDEDNPVKHKRFIGEILNFQNRWGKILEEGDPYYNKNLTLSREDFSFK